MKALLTTKMVEGSYVKDHVLNIMSYINELEILGATIDNECQVEMILQTLLDNFQLFCLNYNMNMMDLSLQQTPPSVAYMVDKPIASSSKSAKAQKKKKKSCKVVEPRGARSGVAKPKGKC
ncbi:hypothetical protein R3W88_031949 [Solanum pinnatisectum]|uniref:Gag/pol protein n=1 Tax=Solanum pinnatisectum TaxID=50273 RepID=A0AAV9LRN9_9SOLN|nr:hypothetical protein R3W88_031949 [Solanum pinnatisectum]